MRRCAWMALKWQESEAVDHRYSLSVARSLKACDLVGWPGDDSSSGSRCEGALKIFWCFFGPLPILINGSPSGVEEDVSV